MSRNPLSRRPSRRRSKCLGVRRGVSGVNTVSASSRHKLDRPTGTGRSRCHDSASSVQWISSARYEGTLWLQQQKASTASRNCILSGTRNQWRSRSLKYFCWWRLSPFWFVAVLTIGLHDFTHIYTENTYKNTTLNLLTCVCANKCERTKYISSSLAL